MEPTAYYSLVVEKSLDIESLTIPITHKEIVPQVVEESNISNNKSSNQILVVLGIVIIGVSVYWGYKYYRTSIELIDQESD